MQEVVLIGHLTMSVPALKKSKGELYLPEFLQSSTGAITCGAEEKNGSFETLYTYAYGTEGIEWNQVKPEGHYKKKRLYLLTETAEGKREFHRIVAKGQMALKIHRNLKKGDCVVVKGMKDEDGAIHVAQIGLYSTVTSKYVPKAE